MTSLVWHERWGRQTKLSRKDVLLGIDLYLGSLPEPIASLVPSHGGIKFRLVTELGIRTRQPYDYPHLLRGEVELLVRKWLYLAGLPVQDESDGSGI